MCGNNALSSSGSDLTCIEVQATLREVNPNDPRLGYVRLPEGKQGESLHRRNLYLRHLGLPATTASSDKRIAAHHFRYGEVVSGALNLTTQSRDHPQCPPYADTELCSRFVPSASGYYNVPNVTKHQFLTDAANVRDLPPLGGGSPSVSYRAASRDSRQRTTDISDLLRNFDAPDYLDEMNKQEKRIAALQEELKASKLTIVDLEEHLENVTLSHAKDLSAIHRLCTGLSRVALTSLAEHDLHPHDAAYYFGFPSFNEARVYFEILHYPLKATTIHDDPKFGKIPDHDIPITEFEQFLITMQHFHLAHEHIPIAKIWNRHPSRISIYISKWAPRIGASGLTMSILDCNDAWIKHELPGEYVEVGMPDVAAVVDGKDFGSATVRSSTLLSRLLYSDKSRGSAGRCLTFSSKIGLIMEHTGLFFGRVSETQLMKLWGSLTTEVPLWQWGKDVPTVEEVGRKAESTKPTLQIMSKYLSKAKAEVVEEDDAVASAREKTKPTLPLLANIAVWFAERKLQAAARKKTGMADPLSAAGITAAQQELLHNHPFRSRASTLAHYETHERLHLAYSSGHLRPCLLSYYLDFFTTDRRRILHHLGSPLHYLGSPLADGALPPAGDLPRLWPRLAKFPKGSELSGDKGFYRDSGALPNQNTIHTPIRLDGRDQYSRGEIVHGRRCKKNRYTSETVFSRVTDVSILCDTVPREHMRHLSDACNWGHGRANIQQPLLKPLNWDAYIASLT